MCRLPFTKEVGWNVHHAVERVKGGSNRLSNLVLFHPICHRQLHNKEVA
ncbi:HNH endonuclease [Paraglaciecola polaris]|nr:HNH endonuclease [Paraglaciecola polaris]